MFFRRSKAKTNDNAPVLEPQILPVTSIAAGTELIGDIVSDGEVRIAGRVAGNVDVRVCVIEENGIVEGDIRAEEAIIRGRAVGPLAAIFVHLERTAQVDGNVTHDHLVVDSGAELNGSVRRSDQPLDVAPRSNGSRFRHSAPSIARSPLWDGGEDYRPVVAVKPR
jgi:cytoskeletal protein CcmA (bactofilin family)